MASKYIPFTPADAAILLIDQQPAGTTLGDQVTYKRLRTVLLALGLKNLAV